MDDNQTPPSNGGGSSVSDDKKRIRVTRKIGDCGYCDRVRNGSVIQAYDPDVFAGVACPDCVLEGKASAKFKPDAPEMRPVVFVAKALKGIQPFAKLLAAADNHREHPDEARAALARAQQQPTIGTRDLLRTTTTMNHAQRRRTEAIMRKQQKKAKKSKPN